MVANKQGRFSKTIRNKKRTHHIKGKLRFLLFGVPAGNPAFSANATMANADKGVSSAGLITTVHPHASAAAAFEAKKISRNYLK